eukprot:3810132-Rhodomonas_salina.5
MAGFDIDFGSPEGFEWSGKIALFVAMIMVSLNRCAKIAEKSAARYKRYQKPGFVPGCPRACQPATSPAGSSSPTSSLCYCQYERFVAAYATVGTEAYARTVVVAAYATATRCPVLILRHATTSMSLARSPSPLALSSPTSSLHEYKKIGGRRGTRLGPHVQIKCFSARVLYKVYRTCVSSAICLRPSYAMSGTEIAYGGVGATVVGRDQTADGYAPTLSYYAPAMMLPYRSARYCAVHSLGAMSQYHY